jgi:hypothetical protein
VCVEREREREKERKFYNMDTSSKSGSTGSNNYEPSPLRDFTTPADKLTGSGSGAKKPNRKQFRPPDDRGSKGRTLPRVHTLPSGGFYRLQRPCDDVVSLYNYNLAYHRWVTLF